MAKSDGILGIDVRHGKLSMSILRGGKIHKTAWADIPGNIVNDDQILSEKLFSEFIKDKMKENGIKAKKAVCVISDSDLVIRSFDMPEMDDEQLKLNVPYEFSDYISGDMKEYIFDFVKRKSDGEEAKGKVNLIAYAVPVEIVRKIGSTLRLIGMRLERAVPETLCYEMLLAGLKDEEDVKKERCFLDIGSTHMTMRIFKDGAYRLTHIIDIGENKIIQSIADELNVDVNLAETYLRSNYQDCRNCRSATNAYKDISLEIIKGLNYYDMSDMTSKLRDVVLCGPGALTEPLVMLLQERIDKAVYTIQELFPDGPEDPGLNVSFTSATVLNCLTDNIGIPESAAYADVKKTDWKLVALGVVAAIAAIVAFAKIGIVDKYAALNKAEAHQAELQDRVNADLMFIQQSEELSVEYYHYTWDDMTAEEKGRVSRVDVAQLADFIVSQGVSVKSLDLKESTLVVDVVGDSLNTMSRLTAALTDQDIVESCSLTTAKKESADENVTRPQTLSRKPVQYEEEDAVDEEIVDEEIVDEFGNEIEDETDDEFAYDLSDEYYSEDTSDNIVNATINIYLTTLDAENRGGEQ